MRTLKLSIAIAAVALSSVICQAQPNGGNSGRHNNGINHKSDEHPQKYDKGAILVAVNNIKTIESPIDSLFLS